MILLFIKGYQIERFIGNAIAILLVMILIFLLIRQIVCWYWKINERTKLLYDIRGLLMRLVDNNAEKNSSYIDEVSDETKKESTNDITP